ncbi:ARM repeat-containing protein [Auriculariales sp. MPI-PUGE-AT-0066]|nr:ARM repeat-containing protein [Auriculariales sp. MPI-PUGE-AT-0066]
MDPNQLVQAILIAADTSATDRALQHQALTFLNNINPNDAWPASLQVFLAAGPDGARTHPPAARHFALKVVCAFLGSGIDPLDDATVAHVKTSFSQYLQTEFVYGPAEASAPFLRNAVALVLALFFLRVYPAQWSTFFPDIITLLGTANTQPSAPGLALLFFHTIIEISNEIFDQLLKSAREFTTERHARDARIRDAIRNGDDASRMNSAVLALIVDAVDKVRAAREAGKAATIGPHLEIVHWGLRAFALYIPWIDVNFTVTPTTIQLLFTLLSDENVSVRLASCNALLRMVQKGLKGGNDKLQLFKVLSLGEVLRALEERTRAEKTARAEPDEDEEQFREHLGRLLDGYGQELLKFVDDTSLDLSLREEFNTLLQDILPTMLNFLGDEYDDTSSTVFRFLGAFLSSQKKPDNRLPSVTAESLRQFWTLTLTVVLKKMRWDSDAEPKDMDEDELQMFDALRKDLRVFMDSILGMDKDLVASAVQQFSLNTLRVLESGVEVPWQDAELAVFLVFIYGELSRSTSGGRRAFVEAPLFEKEQRKAIDYSVFPLTMQGDLMMALMTSRVGQYQHPLVLLQYFETISRYGDFFRVRKECILPALESFLGPLGVHSSDRSVQSRAFYLFQKFVKDLRSDITPQLVPTLVNGLRDVLVPVVVLSDSADSSGRSSPATPSDALDDAVAQPTIFDSQMHLYESLGALTSLLYETPNEHAALLRSVVQPLLDELSNGLSAVSAATASDNLLSILKVHHVISALGGIARGYPDFPRTPTADFVPPPVEVFQQMAQGILVALDTLNVFKAIRSAARTAFGRLFAAAGEHVVQLMPALMRSLLSHFDPTELSEFVNFMSHLAHKLEGNVFGVMNELIVPLNSHVSEIVSNAQAGELHSETKKFYFSFLCSLMKAKLQDIFTSEQNQSQLQGVLEFTLRTAQNALEPGTARLATDFLQACVIVWAVPSGAAVANGPGTPQFAASTLPGFETFLYKQLVPLPFEIASSPSCNPLDGQTVVLLNSLADFLKTVHRVRGQEVLDYLTTVYLPAQNCPVDVAMGFTSAITGGDVKAFRRYFVDFVKSLRR